MRSVFLSLLLLTVSVKSFSQNHINHEYENLVFEGAGIRGIAYSGAIHELEKSQILPGIKKVAGTSAGAITALMLSLNYTSAEIDSVLSQTKFQKFNDGEFFFIGGFYRLSHRYGWYKSNAFNKWLEGIIRKKTGNADITFAGLKEKGFKDLYVTTACLNRQVLLILSAESYPNMKIKDAVRASMSIPLYFEAVFMDSTGRVYVGKKHAGKDLDILVDGGIIANYPIQVFDSVVADPAGKYIRIANGKTLGIRIDSDSQIKSDSLSKTLCPIPINSIGEYMHAFYVFSMENLNRKDLTKEDWERTISVSSVGIGPRVRKLSEAEKDALVKSGEMYTARYIKGKSLND